MFGAVLVINIIRDQIPVAGVKIDIDIRLLGPLQAEEAFEKEPPGDGINFRDPKAIGHRRIRGRTPPRIADPFGVGKAHHIPHNEEIIGHIQLFDDGQLMFQTLPDPGAQTAVALMGPVPNEPPQKMACLFLSRVAGEEVAT